eukprot:GEMP01009234.1.p1 GENE.GEMP01009234.1~~GEMP01009234.1.p1  ORF type:complete len:789 (+),score=199.65 GEMP01009234.1:679-3045(+)
MVVAFSNPEQDTDEGAARHGQNIDDAALRECARFLTADVEAKRLQSPRRKSRDFDVEAKPARELYGCCGSGAREWPSWSESSTPMPYLLLSHGASFPSTAAPSLKEACLTSALSDGASGNTVDSVIGQAKEAPVSWTWAQRSNDDLCDVLLDRAVDDTIKDDSGVLNGRRLRYQPDTCASVWSSMAARDSLCASPESRNLAMMGDVKADSAPRSPRLEDDDRSAGASPWPSTLGQTLNASMLGGHCAAGIVRRPCVPNDGILGASAQSVDWHKHRISPQSTPQQRHCKCPELLRELNERMDTIAELNARTAQMLNKTIHEEAALKDSHRQLQLLQHKYSMVDHELDAHKRQIATHSNFTPWAFQALEVLLADENRVDAQGKTSIARLMTEAKRDEEVGDQFVRQLKEWLTTGTLRVDWGRKNDALVSTIDDDARNNEIQLELQNLRKEVRVLRDQLQESKGTFRVFCRLKPSAEPCVKVANTLSTSVKIVSPQVCGHRPSLFYFDRVFEASATQDDVYVEVHDVISNLAISGFHGVIMAYGQTGSGKTHTLDGSEEEPGLQRRAIQHILEAMRGADTQFEFSALEIYNEQVCDLLAPCSANLEVRQNPSVGEHQLFGQIYLPNLTQQSITCWKDVHRSLELIKNVRRSAATTLNDCSSRSHTIVSLGIRRPNSFGAVHFVDLAGSERTKHSQAEGARMTEANCINRSLSALGDALLALEQRKSHVPFRNSKLSYLLSDVLSQRWSKVMMIATCATDPRNAHESFSTLSFANRVQNIEKGKLQQSSRGA